MNEYQEDNSGPPLTKRERKRLRRQGIHNEATSSRTGGLQIRSIIPKTSNQAKVFDAYNAGQHVLIHGLPGTGKTFLSLFLAVRELFQNPDYEKIIIVRSIVPTRDIGFLPGSKADKMREYEAPYASICTELFGRGDSYSILKQKNLIEFMPTSFIRGMTINNAIVIIDELQNLNGHECDSVITRLGENSRLVMCGDYRQSDLKWADEKQGVLDFMDVLHRMRSISKIEMLEDDIVRSGLVKEYIITKAKMKLI